MTVASRIDKQSNTIIRTVTGALTVADLVAAFEASLSDPDFKKDMHVIWDLSEADISQIPSAKLLDAVEYIGAHADTRGTAYRIAIVAPADINFAVSRMFEGYGSGMLPLAINVFRNRERAFEWIAEAAETV